MKTTKEQAKNAKRAYWLLRDIWSKGADYDNVENRDDRNLPVYSGDASEETFMMFRVLVSHLCLFAHSDIDGLRKCDYREKVESILDEIENLPTGTQEDDIREYIHQAFRLCCDLYRALIF